MDLIWGGLQLHLLFFRNLLVEKFRAYKKYFNIFYSMSEDEGCDESMKADIEKHGFLVTFEDMGARRTIFDNYDMPAHFQRIAVFEKIYSQFGGWTEDLASELSFYMEELHPYLFNILFAATRTFDRAEVIEELSQACLSGRRFIEHLTDFLFPPQNEQFEGHDGKKRNVKKNHYINRLYAYISQTMDKAECFNSDKLMTIGKTAESLYDIFCKGIHKPYSSNKAFQKIKGDYQTEFSDLGKWLLELINIDPASVRRPYSAYNEEVFLFLKDLIK